MSDEPEMLYAFEDFLTPGMYYYLSDNREYVERMMRYCMSGVTDDFRYGAERLRMVSIHPSRLGSLDKSQFARPIPEDYTNESKRVYGYWVESGRQVTRPMA